MQITVGQSPQEVLIASSCRLVENIIPSGVPTEVHAKVKGVLYEIWRVEQVDRPKWVDQGDEEGAEQVDETEPRGFA